MPSYSELIQMAKANSERGAQHLQDMKKRKEDQDKHAQAQSRQKEAERRLAQDEISKRRKIAELRNKELQDGRIHQRNMTRSVQDVGSSVGYSAASSSKARAAAQTSSPGASKREALTREEKRQLKQKKDLGDLDKASRTRSQASSLQSNYKAGNLVALNTNKRDTRSVEEIQRDLKNKKESKQQTSDVARNLKTEKRLTPASKSQVTQRAGEHLVNESGDEYSSHAIWSLFGKDKAKYLERDYDSDESDAGMEATNQDVYDEELTSSRHGKREDEREAENLRRREAEKKRRKLAT